MSVQQFRLPDVGEGLTEAEIVTWRVAPGDPVGLNDVIVDIETAKAVVELPSPYAGVVDRLLAEEGQTVEVGAPIIAIRVPGDGPATPSADEPSTGDEPAADEPAEERTAVLVGY
ncbi:biotin/lipoyl-containing protein, partial [Micromonospora sp. AB353]|uniref:biotin/lipoyl-containing protein n=1 Tax=Micromonospora sp. AB353 TaxID=3413282 RepID=UPI003C16D975